ncbi:cysteine and histidine-rich domain-containing protein 1 [Strongylocentrotus purpuratus]|uniref:Cysteine and histidine-rich domain-containing protein 1 n=1 Tax=Strongylocentrotus purpuratus TaxID=7668 RepID=A0A7M7RHQ2_STRPU|nr:cysteine and histidine-rich domain-containing protein 1 [Strongylocentrotus purpuratus]
MNCRTRIFLSKLFLLLRLRKHFVLFLDKPSIKRSIMSAENPEKLQCYNKGCGRVYSPEEDVPDCCIHHPGAPVFHDALKGWTCCKKRTTDFTEFLNIPGCGRSKHNPVKPVEEPKPQSTNTDDIVPEEAVVPPPRQPIQNADPEERPSLDEPMIKLPLCVDPSLKAALERMSLNAQTQQGTTEGDEDIKKGTICKNKGCRMPYEGEMSLTERCKHHPGAAIFHEGMKYWSCCNRKTSDFNNFLNQEGCTTGSHVFKSTESEEKQLVACRHDWHQTGKMAVLSVYCKKSEPSATVVQANQVSLDIQISFNQQKSEFRKTIKLEGVIDPGSSVVNMFGSKVEIKLIKAESMSWKKFELE